MLSSFVRTGEGREEKTREEGGKVRLEERGEDRMDRKLDDSEKHRGKLGRHYSQYPKCGNKSKCPQMNDKMWYIHTME